MTGIAKISIQVGTRSLSAEGAEEFVREAIKLWDRLEAVNEPDRGGGPSPDADPAASPIRSSRHLAGTSEFENVFDEVDGRLKIIAGVPGSSKAEKTRSVALVTLYGHYLRGEEQIPSEVIRDACADQGCFDPANFAQYLKSLKEKVAMNTKPGGGYDVKLTAPGRKAARELVASLNQEDN